MHTTFDIGSELFDIVNKKGLTDLFAISRFECTIYKVQIYTYYTHITSLINIHTNVFIFTLQVPTHDPNGAEIPKWKREMMAKKAAEKGKKEAITQKNKDEEDRKMAAMPAWKKDLIQKKMEDPKR